MKEVLAKIKPRPEEERKVKRATADFLKLLNSRLKEAKAILGGSSAKGTWLSGNHDVDIFVLFDYRKYASQSDQLSALLEPWLKKAFPKLKISRLHGSRDYFQINFAGLNFEVVPILKISQAKMALNITDISPLHSAWVNKHTQKIKEEILLAKQFCKAQEMYGAESYLSGFSGYVLEILIAHYSSFNKLLQASQNWKVKEVIDVEKHYPRKDALFHLNQSKLQSPLIVIDPVDKSRNAAAALSLEKFLWFKNIAKAYLRKPKVSFFEKEVLNFEKLKSEAERKKLNLVFIKVLVAEGKEDVVGAKVVKAFDFLKRKLEQFEIKKSRWEWNRQQQVLFCFFLAKRELPKEEIRVGPPLKLKEFVKEFKKKYPSTYEERGKILAKVKRDIFRLGDMVKKALSESYFLEKIQKVKEVKVV